MPRKLTKEDIQQIADAVGQGGELSKVLYNELQPYLGQELSREQLNAFVTELGNKYMMLFSKSSMEPTDPANRAAPYFNSIDQERQQEAQAVLEGQRQQKVRNDEAQKVQGLLAQQPPAPMSNALKRSLVTTLGSKVQSNLQEGNSYARSMRELFTEAYPSLMNPEAFDLGSRNQLLKSLKHLGLNRNNPEVRKVHMNDLVNRTFPQLTGDEKKAMVENLDSVATTFHAEKEHHAKHYRPKPNTTDDVEMYRALNEERDIDYLRDRFRKRIEDPEEKDLLPFSERFEGLSSAQKKAREMRLFLAGVQEDAQGRIIPNIEKYNRTHFEEAKGHLDKGLGMTSAANLKKNLDDTLIDRKNAYKDYQNSHEDAVISKMKKDVDERWRDSVLPSLTAQFIQKGAFNSGGHKRLKEEAKLRMEEALADRMSTFRHQGFETAQGHAAKAIDEKIRAGGLKADAEFKEADKLRQGADQLQNMGERDLKVNLFKTGLVEGVGETDRAERQKEKDYVARHELEQEMDKKLAEVQLQEIRAGTAPIAQLQEADRKYLDLRPGMKSTAAQVGNLAGQVASNYMANQGRQGHHRQGGPVKAYAQGGSPMGTPSAYKLEDYANQLTRPGPDPTWTALSHGFARGLANPYEFGSFGKGLEKGMEANTKERQQSAERTYKAAQIHNLIEDSRQKQAQREQEFALKNREFGLHEKKFGLESGRNSMLNKLTEAQLNKINWEMDPSRGPSLEDQIKAETFKGLKMKNSLGPQAKLGPVEAAEAKAAAGTLYRPKGFIDSALELFGSNDASGHKAAQAKLDTLRGGSPKSSPMPSSGDDYMNLSNQRRSQLASS